MAKAAHVYWSLKGTQVGSMVCWYWPMAGCSHGQMTPLCGCGMVTLANALRLLKAMLIRLEARWSWLTGGCSHGLRTIHYVCGMKKAVHAWEPSKDILEESMER